MKEPINKPGPFVEFRDMQDLLSYVDTDEWENNGGVSSRRGEKGFTWTANWDEAAKLARTGWHDGVKDMGDRLERIESLVRYAPADYYWDVTGLSFDIGAVMSGEPECWLEQDMAPKKRLFRFEVNPSCSGSIKGEILMNRGCAVVALIDLLQKDPNNIVELDVVRINSEGTYVLHMGLSPIDLDELAFCMAHPSYNRRLMFAVTEKINNFDYCDGYGSSVDGMSYETERITVDDDGTVNVYLPRAYGTDDGKNMAPFTTIEGAAQWVNRVAKQILGGREQE